MKLSIKKWLTVLVCGSFWCVIANQFVVKKTPEKKSKELSRSKLQESCCQHMAELLREIPALLRSIADMQQAGMKHVCGFIEGDKAAALEKSDKEQLQEMHSKLTAMLAYVKEANGKLAQQAKDLQAF